MDAKGIDLKMTELTKRLAVLSKDIEELEVEIEDLNYELEDLEEEYTKTEDQIKKLKQQLIKTLSVDLDKLTGDRFTDSFILASMFCDRCDNNKQALNGVYLTDTEMLATDTHKGILISGLSIPQALQGKLIKWDTRAYFEQHIVDFKGEYPKLKPLINDISKDIKQLHEGVKPTEFYTKFNSYLHTKDQGREIVILAFGEEKTAFNKDYLDAAISVFMGNQFNIGFKGSLQPILFFTDNIKIAVLPIRVMNFDPIKK